MLVYVHEQDMYLACSFNFHVLSQIPRSGGISCKRLPASTSEIFTPSQDNTYIFLTLCHRQQGARPRCSRRHADTASSTHPNAGDLTVGRPHGGSCHPPCTSCPPGENNRMHRHPGCHELALQEGARNPDCFETSHRHSCRAIYFRYS